MSNDKIIKIGIWNSGEISTGNHLKDRFEQVNAYGQTINNFNAHVYEIKILKYPFYLDIVNDFSLAVAYEDPTRFQRIFIDENRIIDIHNPFEYIEFEKEFPDTEKELFGDNLPADIFLIKTKFEKLKGGKKNAKR